jgi:hypothetical protein
MLEKTIDNQQSTIKNPLGFSIRWRIPIKIQARTGSG